MTRTLAALALGLGLTAGPARSELMVDLNGYSPRCGVAVRREGDHLRISWPLAEGEQGHLTLNLTPGQPLIDDLAIATAAQGKPATLLHDVEPVTFLTVGTRRAPSGPAAGNRIPGTARASAGRTSGSATR